MSVHSSHLITLSFFPPWWQSLTIISLSLSLPSLVSLSLTHTHKHKHFSLICVLTLANIISLSHWLRNTSHLSLIATLPHTRHLMHTLTRTHSHARTHTHALASYLSLSHSFLFPISSEKLSLKKFSVPKPENNYPPRNETTNCTKTKTKKLGAFKRVWTLSPNMKMAKFCQEGAAANLGLMVAGLHL